MNKITMWTNVQLNWQEKEVYRSLRINLEFTGIENKVITMTSIMPHDGKSTITWGLANLLAESGKKTLVIDCDLRKSVLLQRYKIRGIEKGLTHYLSGQTELNDIIYATEKMNLYLIPTGPFPANPTELLENSRFTKMLQLMKKTFDYVLLDTTPLGYVIDAAVVAKVSDGSILVLAADTTSKAEAKRVVEQLRIANENILGVVLNKVNVTRGSYYGRYGRYGDY